MKAAGGSVMSSTLVLVLVYLVVCAGSVRGDFVYSEPTKVPNVNSEYSDGAVQISRDGLELYFLSNRDSSERKGRGDMWISKRLTMNDPWPEPTKLGGPLDSTRPLETPTVSADGLELYFADGEVGAPRAPGGYGGSDLWVSTRASRDDSWGVPENLGPTINTGYNENTPCISADGLELYYSLNIPDHPKNAEVWVARRATRTAPWEEPVILGANVNESLYEYTPFISADGLTLFVSRGTSLSHMHMCRRVTINSSWGPSEPFTPVNSANSPWSGMAEYCVSFAQGDSVIYFTRGTDVFADDYNIWQVTATPATDFNHDGVTDGNDLSLLMDHWGQAEPSYDIGPLPVGDGLVTDADLEAFYDRVDRNLVVVPTPALNATDVTPFASLNWTRRANAEAFDVYFGTSFDDVLDASCDNPLGVLASQGQNGNTYDPKTALHYGQTYHWRVDEIRDQSDSDVMKGIVWSFTVKPRSESPTESINVLSATASSAIAGADPEHTINGSGLNADDLHSTVGTAMWLSAADGPQPIWIQYVFNGIYPLDAMWVWNYNGQFEQILGNGCKNVTIEYSQDGVSWTTLGDFEFARAISQNDYGYNTVVNFGGAMARSVRLTPRSNWGGITPQYGLSEVRFFYESPLGDEIRAAND